MPSCATRRRPRKREHHKASVAMKCSGDCTAEVLGTVEETAREHGQQLVALFLLVHVERGCEDVLRLGAKVDLQN